MKTDIAHDYRACGMNSSGLLDSIMAWNLTSGMGLDELISTSNSSDSRDQTAQPGKTGLFWSVVNYLTQSVAGFFPSFYVVHNIPSQLYLESELEL